MKIGETLVACILKKLVNNSQFSTSFLKLDRQRKTCKTLKEHWKRIARLFESRTLGKHNQPVFSANKAFN